MGTSKTRILSNQFLVKEKRTVADADRDGRVCLINLSVRFMKE